jgi:hypothetical protein
MSQETNSQSQRTSQEGIRARPEVVVTAFVSLLRNDENHFSADTARFFENSDSFDSKIMEKIIQLIQDHGLILPDEELRSYVSELHAKKSTSQTPATTSNNNNNNDQIENIISDLCLNSHLFLRAMLDFGRPSDLVKQYTDREWALIHVVQERRAFVVIDGALVRLYVGGIRDDALTIGKALTANAPDQEAFAAVALLLAKIVSIDAVDESVVADAAGNASNDDPEWTIRKILPSQKGGVSAASSRLSVALAQSLPLRRFLASSQRLTIGDFIRRQYAAAENTVLKKQFDTARDNDHRNFAVAMTDATQRAFDDRHVLTPVAVPATVVGGHDQPAVFSDDSAPRLIVGPSGGGKTFGALALQPISNGRIFSDVGADAFATGLDGRSNFFFSWDNLIEDATKKIITKQDALVALGVHFLKNKSFDELLSEAKNNNNNNEKLIDELTARKLWTFLTNLLLVRDGLCSFVLIHIIVRALASNSGAREKMDQGKMQAFVGNLARDDNTNTSNNNNNNNNNNLAALLDSCIDWNGIHRSIERACDAELVEDPQRCGDLFLILDEIGQYPFFMRGLISCWDQLKPILKTKLLYMSMSSKLFLIGVGTGAQDVGSRNGPVIEMCTIDSRAVFLKQLKHFMAVEPKAKNPGLGHFAECLFDFMYVKVEAKSTSATRNSKINKKNNKNNNNNNNHNNNNDNNQDAAAAADESPDTSTNEIEGRTYGSRRGVNVPLERFGQLVTNPRCAALAIQLIEAAFSNAPARSQQEASSKQPVWLWNPATVGSCVAGWLPQTISRFSSMSGLARFSDRQRFDIFSLALRVLLCRWNCISDELFNLLLTRCGVLDDTARWVKNVEPVHQVLESSSDGKSFFVIHKQTPRFRMSEAYVVMFLVMSGNYDSFSSGMIVAGLPQYDLFELGVAEYVKLALMLNLADEFPDKSPQQLDRLPDFARMLVENNVCGVKEVQLKQLSYWLGGGSAAAVARLKKDAEEWKQFVQAGNAMVLINGDQEAPFADVVVLVHGFLILIQCKYVQDNNHVQFELEFKKMLEDGKFSDDADEEEQQLKDTNTNESAKKTSTFENETCRQILADCCCLNNNNEDEDDDKSCIDQNLKAKLIACIILKNELTENQQLKINSSPELNGAKRYVFSAFRDQSNSSLSTLYPVLTSSFREKYDDPDRRAVAETLTNRIVDTTVNLAKNFVHQNNQHQ